MAAVLVEKARMIQRDAILRGTNEDGDGAKASSPSCLASGHDYEGQKTRRRWPSGSVVTKV